MTDRPASRQWLGVIEEFRDRLDMPEGTPVITLREGGTPMVESAYADRAVQPMGETRTRYHVAIDVDDKAGVLAAVANAFADHDVSIQTVRQEGRGADAQLVVVSHAAPDSALAATVEQLRSMAIVREVTSVMRVEGDAE